MARIKGAGIRGILKFVKQTGGQVKVADVLADLPPGERAIFDHTILTGEWYPYSAYVELLRVVDRRIGGGEPQFLPRLGHFAARQDISGIFKIISVLASIPRILQSASTFWSRYHDTGRFEIVELHEAEGTAQILDFPQMSREHTHVMAGWIEGVGLASGARQAEVELLRAYHRGDPWVEYRMSWAK